jgi:hypothetical protein
MTARLSNRLAVWRVGAYLGMLAAFGVVVLVPFGLRDIGFHVAKAWGLGQLTAPVCCLGALPGALIADRMRTLSSRIAPAD